MEFKEEIINMTKEERELKKEDLLIELEQHKNEFEYLESKIGEDPKYTDIYEDIKYEREAIEKIKDKLDIINSMGKTI